MGSHSYIHVKSTAWPGSGFIQAGMQSKYKKFKVCNRAPNRLLIKPPKKRGNRISPSCQDLFLSICLSPLLHPFPSFIQTDKCFSGAWATVWTKWDGLLCGFWQRKLQLILWLEIWVQKAAKHWAVNQSERMGLSGLQQAVSENLCVGKCVCGPGTYWHMYRLETRLVLTLLLWLLWSY